MRRFMALGTWALFALACGPQDGTSTEGSAESTDNLSAAASALPPVLMGVDANADAEFKSATGLNSQVVRVYLKGGDRIPTSTSAAKLDAYYNAGKYVVYSVKPDQAPDSQSTNMANLASLARSIASQGHASHTWIALHHEPYPELSGPAFQAMYAAYAPSVRSAGVPCGVIYHTYPLYHGYSTYAPDYTSGILPLVDFVGIDHYPNSTPDGYANNILAGISPFTSYAKSNGKPFQIDEVAVDTKVSGTQQAQADWLSGLATLGGHAQLVLYYEGGASFPTLHIENNPAAVTAWQHLYSTLTTR